MKIPRLIPLLFLCLISLIPSVHASSGDPLDIMKFPEKLSEALGIPVFASQILISAIFLLAFLLPCAVWGKTSLPAIIVGFAIMGFLIAIQWLPYWFLLLISLIIALMYAKEIKNLVAGASE